MHERHGFSAFVGATVAVLAAASIARAQGDVERVSVATSGLPADAPSNLASLNRDGRYVVYSSTSSTLVPGVTSGRRHVYLRDRVAGTTTLLSQRLGVEGNGDSDAPVVSADGRWVAFHSDATNLVTFDVNGTTDVYLLDRQTGAFALVSNGYGGAGGGSGTSCCPGISADGRWVAFYSGAHDIVPNDVNGRSDAFVYDRTDLANPYRLVSVGPGGVQADYHSGFSGQGPTSGQIAVASNPNGVDCRVAFQSSASNLVVGSDWGVETVYLRDTELATTELVSASSTGAALNGASVGLAMTPDARYVAFNTSASGVVPGDTGVLDTFLRDRVAGTTVKISVSSQQIPGAGGGFIAPYPYAPSISDDGRFVAFESPSPTLVPNDVNVKNSVFVRDVVAQRTWRVDSSASGTPADDHCVAPWISGDGRVVAFTSAATNLVGVDANAAPDVYVESFRATTFGYCFGDGTGAACPCGNAGAREKGCENSHGTGGALLVGVGTTSVANDTFVLAVSTATPNTTVLFFQGTTQVATAFGDGIRCAGGSNVRIGDRTASASGSRSLGHGIAGDPSISVAGLVPPTGGSRTYQAWYRNAAPYCSPSTFNLSNGLSVQWTP